MFNEIWKAISHTYPAQSDTYPAQSGKKILVLISIMMALLVVLSGCTREQPNEEAEPSIETEPVSVTAAPVTETEQPSSTSEAEFVGEVILADGGCCAGGIEGETIEIQAAFTAQSSAGNVTEMRISDAGSCATEEMMGQIPWESFASEKSFPVTLVINWMGFYVSAQFRDEQGNLSPIYCDDISVEGMPIPPTEGASESPVSGEVILEEGRCCAGGVEGQTIEIQAAFMAESTAGNVTELRISETGGCATQEIMDQSSWEPFVSEKGFPFEVAINWVGFYLSVQYRDDAGNLSPIYCDDISVEGMPASPTP